jgi:hypothetical protein
MSALDKAVAANRASNNGEKTVTSETQAQAEWNVPTRLAYLAYIVGVSLLLLSARNQQRCPAAVIVLQASNRRHENLGARLLVRLSNKKRETPQSLSQQLRATVPHLSFCEVRLPG